MITIMLISLTVTRSSQTMLENCDHAVSARSPAAAARGTLQEKLFGQLHLQVLHAHPDTERKRTEGGGVLSEGHLSGLSFGDSLMLAECNAGVFSSLPWWWECPPHFGSPETALRILQCLRALCLPLCAHKRTYNLAQLPEIDTSSIEDFWLFLRWVCLGFGAQLSTRKVKDHSRSR